MQYTYWDVFFTAQNSFRTHWFWCLLLLLEFFISSLPHQQNISLWGVFSSRETKKVTQGKIRWIQKVRHGRSWRFLVKNCWMLSAVWEGALVNHSSWNGQMYWKILQKNSLKQNTASLNNTNWDTDTYEFLEHSPSGGNPPESNYRIFLGPPLIHSLLLKGHIMPHHFYKRHTSPDYANRNKSKGGFHFYKKGQIAKIAFSICFATTVMKAVCTTAVRVAPPNSFPRNHTQHPHVMPPYFKLCLWASVLYLELFCVSVS